MTDPEDELQRMREEDSTGNRLDREAGKADHDFVDAIVDALDAVDDGDESETITAYDPTLAALLRALEDDDRLDDVFEQLQDAYNGDAGISTASRSAIIRLAVRVGLQEGTEHVMDDVTEAITKNQTPTV